MGDTEGRNIFSFKYTILYLSNAGVLDLETLFLNYSN